MALVKKKFNLTYTLKNQGKKELNPELPVGREEQRLEQKQIKYKIIGKKSTK